MIYICWLILENWCYASYSHCTPPRQSYALSPLSLARLWCTHNSLDLQLYCIDLQLNCIDLQLYCIDLQLNCIDLQLYCIDLQLNCIDLQLYCIDLQLNCIDLQKLTHPALRSNFKILVCTQ